MWGELKGKGEKVFEMAVGLLSYRVIVDLLSIYCWFVRILLVLWSGLVGFIGDRDNFLNFIIDFEILYLKFVFWETFVYTSVSGNQKLGNALINAFYPPPSLCWYVNV